jgi:hypothetical protein
MEKIGFERINVDKNYRIVKGVEVDGYTMKLNMENLTNCLPDIEGLADAKKQRD